VHVTALHGRATRERACTVRSKACLREDSALDISQLTSVEHASLHVVVQLLHVASSALAHPKFGSTVGADAHVDLLLRLLLLLLLLELCVVVLLLVTAQQLDHFCLRLLFLLDRLNLLLHQLLCVWLPLLHLLLCVWLPLIHLLLCVLLSLIHLLLCV